VALLLVLIALAVTVIVASVLLAESATAVRIAHNIESRSRARMIAESGLEAAVAYVRGDESNSASPTVAFSGRRVRAGR
jgi:type II secretory pathway component PulK